MDLVITTNKQLCFYYWVQAVCAWDDSSVCRNDYAWYREQLPDLSDTHKDSLSTIKEILLKSDSPRAILAELYSNIPSSNEANDIVQLSLKFRDIFDRTVWKDNENYLARVSEQLKSLDFAPLYEDISKIKHFLDSDINQDETFSLYLIQNPPHSRAKGHSISGSDILLLHPPGADKNTPLSLVINLITHEYIHAIEFKSKIYRNLAKNSFLKYIEPKGLKSLPGYTWNMVFAETIVYCFANNIVGGYLNPRTLDKPMPTLSEHKDKFWKMVESGKYSSEQILSWFALNILKDVEDCISNKKTIDQKITDKIAASIVEFYERKPSYIQTP